MIRFGMETLWRRLRGHFRRPPAIVKSIVSVQGLGLGLLEDGRPFLTEAALVRVCGTASAGSLVPLQTRLGDTPQTIHPIDHRLAALIKMSRRHSPVCSNIQTNLMKRELVRFVRIQVGDAPSPFVSNEWLRFHQRMTILQNYVPAGQFTVPKEIADLGVALALVGMPAPATTEAILVADQLWWDHWNANGYATRFSERQVYFNAYPAYLPHGTKASQRPHAFPSEALSVFRAWIMSSNVGVQLGLDLHLVKRPAWLWPLSVAELAPRATLV